ncbi:MAG TPA: hypothetical protein VGB08_00650 [Allosphingosinicella sp.]|jgi:hypothetical protein
MIRILLALALATLAAAPAAAQEAATFTHSASGAVFARSVGEQSIALTRDLDTPNDSVVDYAGANPRESTTVYIFRAAYPDARLWFGQAADTVAGQIPLDVFDAGEEERIAAFGSAAPNAIRRIYMTSQAGPFRTTALLVGQAGEWIVKIRLTSPTLDRAGMAARIGAFAAAIRFPAATAFAAAAAPLADCGALPFPQGARPVEMDVERLALMTGVAAAMAAEARAPLRDGGAGWCRVAGNRSNPPLRVIRRADGTGGWIFLIGDAGRALSARSAAELGLPGGGLAALVAADSDVVGVAGAYEGLPDPISSFQPGTQVLFRRARPVIEIGRRPQAQEAPAPGKR